MVFRTAIDFLGPFQVVIGITKDPTSPSVDAEVPVDHVWLVLSDVDQLGMNGFRRAHNVRVQAL
jgi:hypothetical protein